MKFLKTLGGAVVTATVQTAAGCCMCFCALMALGYAVDKHDALMRKEWEKEAEEATKTE